MNLKGNNTNFYTTPKFLGWILALVTFALYAQTITYGFVLDDAAVIEKNKFIQQGFGGIGKIFSTFYWQGYTTINDGIYRPLSLLMFAIEWQLMPNQPILHHVVNILLYVLSIVLLFKILRYYFSNISIGVPFFIALLFAVHPIHTEVVANIKSRDEILCFLFLLLTTHFYLIKNNKWLGLLFFACCLLSKESGVLFFTILLFLQWIKTKSSPLLLTKKNMGLVLLCVAWLALHQYIINSSSYPKKIYTYADNSLLACNDATTQVATSISIMGKYIINCFVPNNLSYDYSYNQIPCAGILSISFLVGAILIISLLAILFWARKKTPVISFGIAFFFLTTLLTSNIFLKIGVTMADRLLFTPVFGLIISFVVAAYYFSKNINTSSFKNYISYLFVAIALVFSIAIFNRSKAWRSNATLFSADINNSPNSAKVQYNAATILFEDSLSISQPTILNEVIDGYKTALTIDSLNKGALINLSVCYYKNEQYQQSLQLSKKALLHLPDEKIINENIADAYFKLNNFDSAIYYYNACFTNNLGKAATYNFCGVAWFNKKEYDSAIVIFKNGIHLFPSNDELWLNYGSALAITTKYEEAIQAFEKTYAINPTQKKALYFLSMAYKALGNTKKADDYMQEYSSKSK
jgi:protein O-mannosyl-transferase